MEKNRQEIAFLPVGDHSCKLLYGYVGGTIL